MSNELKNCPFCGGNELEITKRSLYSFSYESIRCKNCLVEANKGTWNTRPLQSRPEQVNEKLVEALERALYLASDTSDVLTLPQRDSALIDWKRQAKEALANPVVKESLMGETTCKQDWINANLRNSSPANQPVQEATPADDNKTDNSVGGEFDIFDKVHWFIRSKLSIKWLWNPDSTLGGAEIIGIEDAAKVAIEAMVKTSKEILLNSVTAKPTTSEPQAHRMDELVEIAFKALFEEANKNPWNPSAEREANSVITALADAGIIKLQE